mmetsp:Transcript_57318/g.185688  ORF Transcript_57318/g.185688 Transcript_57318/m.185688 type:complete len:261 (-) Transcript_57318:1057-1839(-)
MAAAIAASQGPLAEDLSLAHPSSTIVIAATPTSTITDRGRRIAELAGEALDRVEASSEPLEAARNTEDLNSTITNSERRIAEIAEEAIDIEESSSDPLEAATGTENHSSTSSGRGRRFAEFAEEAPYRDESAREPLAAPDDTEDQHQLPSIIAEVVVPTTMTVDYESFGGELPESSVDEFDQVCASDELLQELQKTQLRWDIAAVSVAPRLPQPVRQRALDTLWQLVGAAQLPGVAWFSAAAFLDHVGVLDAEAIPAENA